MKLKEMIRKFLSHDEFQFAPLKGTISNGQQFVDLDKSEHLLSLRTKESFGAAEYGWTEDVQVDIYRTKNQHFVVVTRSYMHPQDKPSFSVIDQDDYKSMYLRARYSGCSDCKILYSNPYNDELKMDEL